MKGDRAEHDGEEAQLDGLAEVLLGEKSLDATEWADPREVRRQRLERVNPAAHCPVAKDCEQSNAQSQRDTQGRAVQSNLPKAIHHGGRLTKSMGAEHQVLGQPGLR